MPKRFDYLIGVILFLILSIVANAIANEKNEYEKQWGKLNAELLRVYQPGYFFHFLIAAYQQDPLQVKTCFHHMPVDGPEKTPDTRNKSYGKHSLPKQDSP